MNKNIYEAPLVLFLGAGASKPLGLMTTPEFWEWFRNTSDFDIQLLNAIAQSIEPSEETGRKLDIEAVLDVLEKISEANQLKMAIYEHQSFKYLKPAFRSADAIQGNLVEIREKIKDLVVEHYSEIEPQKAFELYRPLIESVLLRPVPIFTTNYDLAWEKTYEFTSDSSYDLKEAPFTLIDGFRRQGRVVTPHWSRSVYEDYKPTGADVILFKLYGSVDWLRTPSKAIQRVESGQRNPGQMQTIMAYPSRLKREIHEDPFRANYDYLLACLVHAKVCAVIGSSFRDQEIVEEFRKAIGLNKDLELMIIDPNAEAIGAHMHNKLGFRPKVDFIKQEFTIESAPSIAYTIEAKVDRMMNVKQKKARRRRVQTVPAMEAVKQALEETIKPVKDELARVTEYLDGLQQATPKIRDSFLEARKLEKKYRYREAINQYEACFQSEATASQRSALHILIGNCYFSLSELEEAEGDYRKGETAAKEADDKKGLAAALGNIGGIYQKKGDLDKAFDYLRQALKIEKEIGRKEGEASQLGNIGLIYQTKGELDKALDYHQQALTIERGIGRKEGEANQLGNIGLIYQTKGELDKALDYHQQSLNINKELGRKEGEAANLDNIGVIYGIKGELDQALEYFHRSLNISRDIEYREGEASNLGNIGLIYRHKGDLDKALDYYQQAIKLDREIGRKEGEASDLGNIGITYHAKGELDKALKYYQQALKINREIGRKKGEASDLGNIGVTYHAKGELDKALKYYQQALKINREIGIKEGGANQLGNIGLIYQTKGELDKALDYHQQALKINREIGGKEGEASQLGNIGNIYQTKGVLDKALDYYQQALKIFEEIGAKLEIEKAKRNIENIRKRMQSSRGQDSDTV